MFIIMKHQVKINFCKHVINMYFIEKVFKIRSTVKYLSFTLFKKKIGTYINLFNTRYKPLKLRKNKNNVLIFTLSNLTTVFNQL